MNRCNPSTPAGPVLRRRLVLGLAFFAAITVWQAPGLPAVHAQETKPPPPTAAPAPPKAALPPAPPAAKASGDTDIRIGPTGIHIRSVPGKGDAAADAPAADAAPDAADTPAARGRRGKRIVINGALDDKDYDSFDAFAHDQPATATVLVAIAAVMFLAPVLAIALILWYRFRKARMLNETMLKLAEKGVVAPADALGALTSGTLPAAATSAAAPIYEQAKAMRARAAWSDLRKGVIMGAIGLGLTFYSMLDDGTPNGIGLVLLFVGIGYVVLWWFEDRQRTPGAGGGAAGGA